MRTPTCQQCGNPYERVENGKGKSAVLIGWRCLTCKKAIMLERGAYKVR